MGCFSYICQKCGRGIKSSSFSGERTHLFLLKNGKVVQQMTGEYNSYGSVFVDNTKPSTIRPLLRQSHDWHDESWTDEDSSDFASGIAAIHEDCYDGVPPTVRSERDPNQGWGDSDEESYFDSTVGEGHHYPKPVPIPGYDVKKELKRGQLRRDIFDLERDFKFQKLKLESCKILGEKECKPFLDGQSLDSLEAEVKQLEDALEQNKKLLEEL